MMKKEDYMALALKEAEKGNLCLDSLFLVTALISEGEAFISDV